jgi:sugar lactone lactonase YvrE
MASFTISLDEIFFIGQGLHRPECVLCTANGRLYTADWRGGVACLEPDGNIQLFSANEPHIDFKPNGIALEKGGSFLIANLGDDGGLYRLHRDGHLEAVLTEVDGLPIPPANFVAIDAADRIWLTVSTRKTPRASTGLSCRHP